MTGDSPIPTLDSYSEEAAALAVEASAAGPAPGEDACVEQFLKTALEGAAQTRPTQRRRWLFPLVTAAAAVAIWLMNPGGAVLVQGTVPWDQGTTLGAGNAEAPLVCQSPSGNVAAYGTFRWLLQMEDVTMPTYTLYLLDADGNEVHPPIPSRAAQWTPDEATLQALPREIEWKVVAKDAAGSMVASASARASLP